MAHAGAGNTGYRRALSNHRANLVFSDRRDLPGEWSHRLHQVSTNVTARVRWPAPVNAVFAPGSYVTKKLHDLTSTVPPAVTRRADHHELPAGITASSLTDRRRAARSRRKSRRGLSGGLNVNQQNVPTASQLSSLRAARCRRGFFSLFGLTGANLGNALTQLSGGWTDSEKGAFQLMDEFLSLMLDPLWMGATGVPAAVRRPALPPSSRPTFRPTSRLLTTPCSRRRHVQPIRGRWDRLGRAYGGYNRPTADAAIGSNNVTVHTSGFCRRPWIIISRPIRLPDLRCRRRHQLGLGARLGTGRSDALQVGVYGKTRSGPWYVRRCVRL